MGLCKYDAMGGELIQPGRMDPGGTVTIQLGPKVIHGNKKDIGWFCFIFWSLAGKNKQGENNAWNNFRNYMFHDTR
jgi:hypothetical protein